MSKELFDSYIPYFYKLYNKRKSQRLELEPFKMPLFSRNFLKKRIVLTKYRYITNSLMECLGKESALDFGTGFGAFLPILSKTHKEVLAVDDYPVQIEVAKDIIDFMGLNNVKATIVERNNGLSEFSDSEFDTILATDVLEHNRDYKSIVLELKRILKPEGILIASLPREHLVYRLFARREVEHDLERGHVYHSSKGADEVEKYLANQFLQLKLVSIYTFIHVMILKKE